MAYRAARALSLVALSLALSASGAFADWFPGGTAVCNLAGRQDGVSASADGLGGAYVAWNDQRAGAAGLYLQRITHDGEIFPGWPAGGIRFVTGANGYLAVADGLGGCYLVWDTAPFGPTSRVRAMHILSGGTIDPVWPAGGYQFVPITGSSLMRAVVDSRGSLIVLYRDSAKQCDERGCYAYYFYAIMTRLNLAGGWTGGTTITSHSTGNGMLSPDANGGVWLTSSDDYYLGVAHLDAAGNWTNAWPYTAYDIGYVFTIASASDDGAFVSWDDFCGGNTFTMQRLLPSGNPAPGWPSHASVLCGTAGHYRGPVITSAGGKRPLIAWTDNNQIDAIRLYATSLDSSGNLAPGWPSGGTVLCDALGIRSIINLVSDGAGGGLTAWQDGRDGRTRDLYATHVAGNGALAPGWMSNGSRVATTLGLAGFPQGIPVVTDGTGGALVFWVDARDSSTTDYDIYAQRLNVDGPVPVQLALVSAEFKDGRVLLDWFAPDAAALNATVYRRTETSAWLAVGGATTDGSGHIRFEDHTVKAGIRYAYRLGYVEQGVEHFAAETWIQVPELTFALDGLRPNPAVGALAVSFSLRNSQPASLEVMDLSGRRIAQREVGSLGAGPHVLELGETRVLNPGIYWLRLRQGDRTLLARGAVVR